MIAEEEQRNEVIRQIQTWTGLHLEAYGSYEHVLGVIAQRKLS